MFFFSSFLYKSIIYGYLHELHRQVDAIQMGSHNICLCEEVEKKYNGCILQTTESLDCSLIEVCAVIRSNTVTQMRVATPTFATCSLNGQTKVQQVLFSLLVHNMVFLHYMQQGLLSLLVRNRVFFPLWCLIDFLLYFPSKRN